MDRLTPWLVAICLIAARIASATPGPDNTLLVVNADSPLSRTVANLYLEQRPLSLYHLVWLHDPPPPGSVSMETFRSKILQPVLDAMDALEAAEWTDAILYSADFPYRVYIEKTVRAAGLRYHKYVGIAASLSGLTWFANLVAAGRADFIAPFANGYYRRELGLEGRVARAMTPQDKKQRSRARALVRGKRYQKALEILEPLLTAYSGYWELHLLRARALAGLGRTHAALMSLEKLPGLGYRKTLALRNLPEFESLHHDPAFMQLLARMDDAQRRFETPIAFSRARHWSRTGLPNGKDFDRYYLSALLAYTGQRGNSLPEIRALLQRSAQADGSHPEGTVYLMENENVRTETRQPWYAVTCARLAALNRKCEILTRGQNGEDGVIPFRRNDIIGLVTGYRHLPWKRHHSTMLPGAIAEALTSYGGDFDNPSQSKLSVFLRHGASGSSGAVTEPYAIPQKFPLPLMHYYYALGFSLGEAWYQAVASPYQTLLVGDPLTRPFAGTPDFEVDCPPQPWRGRVVLHFRTDEPDQVAHYQLWIDGQPLEITGNTLHVDTTRFADGVHEVLFTAVGTPPLESRTTRRYWIRFENQGLAPGLEADREAIEWDERFQLRGQARPNARVEVRHGSRVLHVTRADEQGRWHASLPANRLGLGYTELQIVTRRDDQEAYSNPLKVVVNPPRLEPAVTLGIPEGKSGMALTLEYVDAAPQSKRVEYLDGHLGRYLETGRQVKKARISGYFKVENPGFQQLTQAGCSLRAITIDTRPKRFQGNYLALWLQRGWHHLEAEVTPECLERLTLILGGNSPPLALGKNRSRTGEPALR